MRRMREGNGNDKIMSTALHPQVNGESKVRVGEFVVDDSMSVTLNNFKSYSRVIVSSQDITVSIDYVPPPAHWNVPMESKDDYSHLNLRIDALALTQNANGVLGQVSLNTRSHQS